MQANTTKLLSTATILLVLMYAFGVWGILYFREWFLPLAPLTLLLASVVFVAQQQKSNKHFWQYYIYVCLIGFVAEVAGVHTGVIFGQYYYGQMLGYKLLQVPIIISANWALLVCSCIIIAAKYSSNRYVGSIIAASLTTIIDIPIEQVAPALDFWHWPLQSIAGLHNYIGWWCTAFIASVILYKQLNKGKLNIAWLIVGLNLYFFIMLWLFI
jgi:bisanhydrobacterioruberin hydratase